MYMKGSARARARNNAGTFALYTYDYARHTISHLYSCLLPIFLSIYQRDKVFAYESIKVISRISQADINRRRQVLRSSLVIRRKKRVHPRVQFVRFPLMAIAPRLKFKCVCELPRVRRTYAHRAMRFNDSRATYLSRLIACRRIPLNPLSHDFFPRQKVFY